MYKEHVKFNTFITLPLLLGLIYYFLHPMRSLMLTFSASFIYSTFFMNPDLDLADQIRFFSIRGVLTLPFRFYAKLFKHRGLSHNVFFGSFTRLAWLIGWGWLLFFIFYRKLPSKGFLASLLEDYRWFILYAIAGICFADWSHLLLDRKKG